MTTPSDTPMTDAADDVTMRFTSRHERLKKLCGNLERKLAAANKRIAELRGAKKYLKRKLENN